MSTFVTEAERARMVADYKAGMSAPAIAQAYGRGRNTVTRHLRDAGLELNRGGRPQPKKRVAAWAYAYRNGESTTSIARSAGVGKYTVWKNLVAYGVEMHSYGHRRTPLIQRAMSRVEVRGACWHWCGGTSRKGDQRVGRFMDAGTEYLVHRVVWEHHNGPLGDTKLRRRCDDHLCCNPAHHEKIVVDPWERTLQALTVDPDFYCWVSPVGGKRRARMMGHRETRQTHRVAWEKWRGVIPEDMEIWRRCGNLHCINPDHLHALPLSTSRFEPPEWLLKSPLRCRLGHLMAGPDAKTIEDETGQVERRCLVCRREDDRRLTEDWEEPEPMNPRERFRQMRELQRQGAA